MKYINYEIGNYRALLNTENGDILATEKTAQHRQVKTNINAFINAFPYTDKDFIIIAGRETAGKNMIDRRKFLSFCGVN